MTMMNLVFKFPTNITGGPPCKPCKGLVYHIASEWLDIQWFNDVQ